MASLPEHVTIAAANRTTEAGALTGFIGWFASINWMGLCGVLIALCGFITSLYFQRKRDQREQREHELRVQGLLADRRHHDMPVSHDRRQGGKIGIKLAAALLAASGAGLYGGAQLIRDHESPAGQPITESYQDIVGIWTICDGVTKGVKAGMKVTPEACDEMFYTELLMYDAELKRCGLGDIPPGPYATMMSIGWHNGTGAACKSTAADLLKKGDVIGGCLAALDFVCARAPAGRGDTGGPCATKARDKQWVRGFKVRRINEARVCLGELPA